MRARAFMAIFVLVASTTALLAQRRPVLSGTWKLVVEPAADAAPQPTGRGRGGNAGAVVSIASGAPVNCGTECTIVQTEQTITISRRPDAKGGKPRDVVLVLGGNPPTASPGGPAIYDAKWDGETLLIERSVAQVQVSQRIARAGEQLTVQSTFANPDGTTSSKTLTYSRK